MEQKCTLTDQQLIEVCETLVGNLAAGTEKWRMTVPVDFNRDSDMLLKEVITRFKEQIATPSPAKAEQEGPFPVYDLSHLSEEDKNKFAGEVMKSASESLMATFYSLGLQSHLDQMSVNDANGDCFMLAFRKVVNYKLLGPSLPEAEKEGLRWVNLEDYKFTPWETVCAKWEPQPGNSRRSCCYRSPDGIITWIGEKPREKVKVYILDESTTPPVKEAGQPRNLPIEELIKLSDDELNDEINKVRSRLGMGRSEEAGQPADDKPFDENLAYELIARFVANSGKKDSIKKIRKEAFVDGALWAKKYLESRQQPEGESAVWVKASDRMPDKCGHENKVIIRTVINNIDYVTYGFRTFDTDSPAMYFECGSYCYRRVEGVEWLDESGLASSREREVAIGFLDWIRDETICDGAPKIFHKESKKRVTHEEALNLYLQSTNNK